jgi:5'-nucleotidase
MNILLTNDDGIESEGIQKLALALKQAGTHAVYVLAPDGDRSGVSHALTCLRDPVRLNPYAERMWSCSGNPADCIMLAYMGALPVKPDLVISGINRGANAGTDIVYSGTAAAARQAGLYGIPAIALSLAGNIAPDGSDVAGAEGEYFWDEAISYVMEKLPDLISMCTQDIFINVNIPNSKTAPLGMLSTFPCVRKYNDTLAADNAPDGGTYCFVQLGSISTIANPGSDLDAVLRNYVSVSPVFIHPVVRSDLCPSAPSGFSVSPEPVYKR